jgi:uncharacterized protein YegL
VWNPVNSPTISPEFRCSGTAHPADFDHISMAKEYMNQLEFQGSTNIYSALMTALELAKGFITSNPSLCRNKTTVPSPMIFFLTDGFPTSGIIDDLKILEEVATSNANFKIPIFSVAFGADAHFTLLDAISYQNKGIARITYDSIDAAIQLQDFYNFVASPVLTNISIKYASGLRKPEVSTYPEVITRLARNVEIIVVGQRNKSSVSNISASVQATSASGSQQFSAKVCLCGHCHQNDTIFIVTNSICESDPYKEDLFMERFWAHKRLRELQKAAIPNIPLITELAIKVR